MKISYEKHGVEGIENCLAYLAAFDADDIESDEFEIIGEDEEGREGSADISIINLAEEACRALAAQRKRIAQLEQERDAYRTAEEHQIALRQKIEQERDALAADRADLIQELIPLQNMTHGLARSGGCSPDYPNDAKAVLERVTGGHAPFFDDSGPSAKCLSRRDALKQAEWISSYLRSLPFNTTRISPIDLNIEAKKLLREAEAQQ